MATLTTNYALRKPAGGDIVAVQADIGASMDIIDAEMFEHEGRTDDHELHVHNFVVKSADTTRTSDITPSADPHLTLAIPAAGLYIVQAFVVITCGAGNFQVRYAYPAGNLDMFGMGLNVGVAASTGAFKFRMENDAATPTPSLTFGGDTVTTTNIDLHALLTASAAGNVVIEWSQDTSNAAATIVKQGSFMHFQRVS